MEDIDHEEIGDKNKPRSLDNKAQFEFSMNNSSSKLREPNSKLFDKDYLRNDKSPESKHTSNLSPGKSKQKKSLSITPKMSSTKKLKDKQIVITNEVKKKKNKAGGKHKKKGNKSKEKQGLEIKSQESLQSVKEAELISQNYVEGKDSARSENDKYTDIKSKNIMEKVARKMTILKGILVDSTNRKNKDAKPKVNFVSAIFWIQF